MEGWKRNFYAILAAEVLAIAGFNTSFPILPFYIQSLGVTDPVALKLWVGACAAVVAVTLSLFAPVWGQLADTVGKRPMLLRAMFGGAVTMGLMAVANHPWQILVLRALQGALSGTVAAATVLVANITPVEQVGFSLGLLTTGIYVGSSIGPALGGVLSDLFGYRVNFIATAGLLMLAAVIVVRFVREDRPHAISFGPVWRRMIPDFTPLLGASGLLILLIVSGSLQVASSTVSPILPLFIQSITPSATLVGSTTGLILGLSALCAALTAAVLGRVSYRIGYEKTLVFCLSGAFLFFLPQAFVRTPLQLLVLRMLGGAMIGGSEPSINAMIAMRTNKSRQGVVFGLNSSVNSAGAAVGPMIGASLCAAFGFAAAFFMGAGVLLASALAARTVKKSASGPPHDPPVA